MLNAAFAEELYSHDGDNSTDLDRWENVRGLSLLSAVGSGETYQLCAGARFVSPVGCRLGTPDEASHAGGG